MHHFLVKSCNVMHECSNHKNRIKTKILLYILFLGKSNGISLIFQIKQNILDQLLDFQCSNVANVDNEIEDASDNDLKALKTFNEN